MQSMVPYHGFNQRQVEMFDPFSLYFWDHNFHHDFPFHAPPPMMIPPPMLSCVGPTTIRSKIEYKETPEAHHFRAELPGIRKEDVKVEVEDGSYIHINAKKKHEMEDKKDNYHHVERSFGAFVTKFKLPPNALPQHVRSYMENGVLTVTVPKEKVDKNIEQHGYSY